MIIAGVHVFILKGRIFLISYSFIVVALSRPHISIYTVKPSISNLMWFLLGLLIVVQLGSPSKHKLINEGTVLMI